MHAKNLLVSVGIVVVLFILAFLVASVVPPRTFSQTSQESPQDLDPTPRQVTLSGTYECLPKRGDGPHTMECAFGFRTDDGEHYAVNFGASANAMEQFQSGARVKAEGFVVIKEALSTNQWDSYDMKGIFTVTNVLESSVTTGAQGKIDVSAVCEGALAYMTFPDSASADLFVAECKEGKYPEVIEQWKQQMGLSDDVI